MMVTGKLKKWCHEEEDQFEPRVNEGLGFVMGTVMGKSHRSEIPAYVDKR